MLNWNWLNNDWNDNNPALRFATLFAPNPASLRGSVLPHRLPVPPAEHSSDCLYAFRECAIFLGIKRPRLPCNHKQDAKRIKLAYRDAQIRLLFSARQKTRRCHGFDYFN